MLTLRFQSAFVETYLWAGRVHCLDLSVHPPPSKSPPVSHAMTVKGCLQEDRIFGKCNFYHELTLLSHASLIVHNLEMGLLFPCCLWGRLLTKSSISQYQNVKQQRLLFNLTFTWSCCSNPVEPENLFPTATFTLPLVFSPNAVLSASLQPCLWNVSPAHPQ